MSARRAAVSRKTLETAIELELALDGTGGAEVATGIGFHRYEDFTGDPAAVLKAICGSLQLNFDRGFAERWRDYTFVTGDVSGSRGGGEIRPVPRRPVAPDLLATLAANEDYQASLELLGYEHPDA